MRRPLASGCAKFRAVGSCRSIPFSICSADNVKVWIAWHDVTPLLRLRRSMIERRLTLSKRGGKIGVGQRAMLNERVL
jgi:hypothetical protein